jgi:hypothetical protein
MEVDMKQKQAALYVRVSTGEQNTEAQELALREYVVRRGWMVHKIYRDHGVSGASSNPPARTELLKDCRRGSVDVVVVWATVKANCIHPLQSLQEDSFGSFRLAAANCTIFKDQTKDRVQSAHTRYSRSANSMERNTRVVILRRSAGVIRSATQVLKD